MSQPGVGPVAALAVVLTLGPVERFGRGNRSDGKKQRLL